MNSEIQSYDVAKKIKPTPFRLLLDALQQTWWNNFVRDLKSFAESAPKTKLDKASRVAGVFIWSFTYMTVIAMSHSLQYSPIHRVLVAYNVVWEFGQTFFWIDGDSALKLFTGVFWLGLDLEIIRNFLMYGDGGENKMLEIIEFILWCVAFAVISWAVTRAHTSALRIWKHASFYILTLIDLSILIKSQGKGGSMVYHKIIGWSVFVGTFLYFYCLRKQYEGWWNFFKFPVRFVMMVSGVLPSLLIGVVYVLIAHQVIDYL
jgi:hypothetical protein